MNIKIPMKVATDSMACDSLKICLDHTLSKNHADKNGWYCAHDVSPAMYAAVLTYPEYITAYYLGDMGWRDTIEEGVISNVHYWMPLPPPPEGYENKDK